MMDVGKKAEKEDEEYKMKITSISYEKKKGKASFRVEKTTPEFVNLLRRAIIDRVPTLAMEDIEFRENDSIIYDEIIALRLGLVPLTTDLQTYELPEDCKCEGAGCARCSVILTLKEKGPKTVYASDLKSKDIKVKPAFLATPIVKLLKDQKLEFQATAVLGVGKEHIKWSPGNAWYHYEPTLTVKNNAKLLEQFKDKFPPQIFTKGQIDVKKINACNLYDACDGICEDLIKIDWNENNIIFNIESWGQLDPKQIIKKACEVIDSQLSEFASLLKKA